MQRVGHGCELLLLLFYCVDATERAGPGGRLPATCGADRQRKLLEC